MLAAHRAGRYWGVADASPIVIDEVAGYLLTMALVPFSWSAALAGFLLFRVFDILKPWPASAFDRMKNGFGVVMDDLAAGVYAWAALRALVALGVIG
jgi:phosphatidylglycerophosphatase A